MLQDLWHFIIAIVRRTALVITGTLISLVLLVWPHVAPLIGRKLPDIPDRPFWVVVILCFLWAVFLAWREERRATHPTDMRIADKARALHRTLAATYQHYPNGPATPSDYINWAAQLSNGFQYTDPALDEIVELRPEASQSVRQVVGHVRDAYHAAADIINPLLFSHGQNGMALMQPNAEPELRKAFAHFQRCLAAVDSIATVKE
jgi:hypothetical protein